MIKLEQKLRACVVGATGMVGQRFITLLEDHPFFCVTKLAASPRSAGKTYTEALGGRWKMKTEMPARVADMVMVDAWNIEETCRDIDVIFCAINYDKNETKALEESYAKAEVPVISNNSAHRWTKDVPMVIPEINADHFEIIAEQKKRLGTKHGFIAVKPNCSIQAYVPALNALRAFEPYEVVATTYQAISGAGKTFNEWPEMIDNVIPYIGGEEEKSEQEPLKIWGSMEGGEIVKATMPVITTQCIRVPVTDGHMAAVFVKFKHKPTKEQILDAWKNYKGIPQTEELPSAPKQFITYFEEDNRPQTALDRDIEGGMGVSVGRLREDNVYDFKFVGLAHNTLRGAAGGAVLEAETLVALGYITRK